MARFPANDNAWRFPSLVVAIDSVIVALIALAVAVLLFGCGAVSDARADEPAVRVVERSCADASYEYDEAGHAIGFVVLPLPNQPLDDIAASVTAYACVDGGAWPMPPGTSCSLVAVYAGDGVASALCSDRYLAPTPQTIRFYIRRPR